VLTACGDRDGSGDQRPAVGGARDLELAVKCSQAVHEPLEASALRADAADAVVADLNP
jgi:hypothetical protein